MFVNSNLAGNQMFPFKVICHGFCFWKISTKYVHNMIFNDINKPPHEYMDVDVTIASSNK